MAEGKLGVWLAGGRGGVATTTVLGVAAIRRGMAPAIGVLPDEPPFAGLGLAAWDDLVFGGHEVRRLPIRKTARDLAERSRAFDVRLVEACEADLDAADAAIRPGTLLGASEAVTRLADWSEAAPDETVADAVDRLAGDLTDFSQTYGLRQVVVINVTSTEPPCDAGAAPATWHQLEAALPALTPGVLPPSAIYAIAAFTAGFPYVNFTPSVGSDLPALRELALARKLCHMGRDGKTGETLMKAVLAPMFARRRLEVMSWFGQNIFGNLDGVVLDDPANKQTKIASKDRLLGEILGYRPQTKVGIDYIESLGDWKTAWDHIHFRGFLGTPMTLQFIWQGCDSLLAAPLVLDLARLVDVAARRGEVGTLPFLASFFKSPMDVTEQDFARQYWMLEQWAERIVD